jgi:hypothetical protein
MRVLAVLDHLADTGHAGRPQQLLEFEQVMLATLSTGGDQICALAGSPSWPPAVARL